MQNECDDSNAGRLKFDLGSMQTDEVKADSILYPLTAGSDASPIGEDFRRNNGNVPMSFHAEDMMLIDDKSK